MALNVTLRWIRTGVSTISAAIANAFAAGVGASVTSASGGGAIPYIMENTVADGVVGDPNGYTYSQDLTITGRWLYDNPTDVPTVSIVSGSLPAGLTLNSTLTTKPGYNAKRVTITGTPTTVGTSSVTFQVANAAGNTQKTIQFKTYAYNSARIQPSDMQWIGSFRLQRVPNADIDNSIVQIGYGGRFQGMSLSADRTSLFLCGGPNQKIAEFQIPAPVQSSSLASLNIGNKIQDFTYPFGSYTMADLLQDPAETGTVSWDMLSIRAVGSDLLISGHYFYDLSATYQKYQVIRRPANLALNTPVISSQIGDNTYRKFWTGGIDEISPSFRAAHSLPPYSIGRFGGSGDAKLSLGPAFGAFNPSLMTDKGVVPLTIMSMYPYVDGSTREHALSTEFGYKDAYSTSVANHQNKWWTSGASTHSGTVWLQNKPVVLAIGYAGLGTPWYDLSSGANTDANFPAMAVEEPGVFAHGNHSAPYVQYVWAYSESELAAVLAGTKQPWEAVPYDVWPLPATPYTCQPGAAPWLGGVAHDPVARKIYVCQPARDNSQGGGAYPVIDVYQYPA